MYGITILSRVEYIYTFEINKSHCITTLGQQGLHIRQWPHKISMELKNSAEAAVMTLCHNTLHACCSDTGVNTPTHTAYGVAHVMIMVHAVTAGGIGYAIFILGFCFWRLTC
jgi:hypothetical protein